MPVKKRTLLEIRGRKDVRRKYIYQAVRQNGGRGVSLVRIHKICLSAFMAKRAAVDKLPVIGGDVTETEPGKKGE